MSYNKYYLYKKQVSNDNGQTWEDVTPLETVPSGDVIATYDTLAECESGSTDYSKQYLTFVAEGGNCTFTFTPNNSSLIYYSLNSGSTWTQGTAVTVSSGNKVMWKGEMTPNSGIGRFSGSTGSFHVEGNAMSLLYGDNFEGQTSLSGKDYAFKNLFSGCTTVTSAENLVLPATTLTEGCYEGMFKGCTSLTTAPVLSATTLEYWCYDGMFIGCTSLTTAPQLPATTLAQGCYNGMFSGCTSLTTAPSVLPATTLANWCYQGMFKGCTSLTTAPELPATTLTNWCYDGMFSGCTSLNYIKCLATNISASYCTYYWVSGVSSSGTFVKDSNMSSWSSGASGIPTNWTVQNA